jgi:iron(III) transport system substrate-binding protein
MRAHPEYRAALSAGWSRGMSTLLLVAANARYFTDSSNQVPNDVGNGQAAAGMAIDFYGRVFQDTVGPDRCTVILPASATAITPDPVGIPYGVKGRQLELAGRFVEFLLSPEGQRLWILKVGAPGGPASRAMRRPPIRQDVYAEDRAHWTDDLNPFVDAGGFNQRAEWGGIFSESRMIWVAAWIDNRDALKSAYATILKIRHPPTLRSFLRLLSDLPVRMEDVEKLRAGRRQLEADKLPTDEFMARQRIEWGRKFDAHYRNVEARAQRWLARNPGGRPRKD